MKSGIRLSPFLPSCRFRCLVIKTGKPSCGSGSFNHLFRSFFAESGLPPENGVYLYMGSAGAGRESARSELRGALKNLFHIAAFMSPMMRKGPLPEAVNPGKGILLIAGTCSFCYGKNSRGETCHTGGWGYIMGDEGSGYEMACEILRAVAKAWDGRGKPTVLTELVMEYWHLTGMDELMDCVYRSGKGKSELASLAFLCDIAYDKGDIAAYQIMEKAAGVLSDMVTAASKKLKGDLEKLPCIYTGSLLTESRHLKHHLEEKLLSRCPDMKLHPCKHHAAWGCAALAWRQAA